jgi:hypothetical protein
VVFKVPRQGGSWLANQTQPLTTIPETNNGRVVSSIANRTIQVGQAEYLPVCVTKPMPICSDRREPESCQYYDADSGEVVNDPRQMMGQIRLMNVNNPSLAASAFLANHNYACSSMSFNENNDLLVSGRLTIHAISNADMSEAIRAAEGASDLGTFKGFNNQILLDDVAQRMENGDMVYADGFIVDENTFAAGGSQKVGWRGGTSMAEFDDGTFGVLATNTVRLRNKEGDAVSEVMNVGIHKVTMPNMQERVMVNIQTDPENINNTRIIATYFEGGNFEAYPTTYIPGNYFVNDEARTEPTALPGVMTTMSTADWIDLYRELRAPKGETINEEMPALELSRGATVDCSSAYVDTCAY